MPSTIDTIIGFFTSPNPTVCRVLTDTRPSRDPVIRITISEEKKIRSVASTISIGPADSGPSNSTNIGMPRKPTLPITAHCASTADSAMGRRRRIPTAVAIR